MKILLSILSFLMNVSVFAQQMQKCDLPEHRQLDYWVGEWDVVDQATKKQAGSSSIEKRLDGCMIFESWKGSGGYTGHSFNLYNRETKKWQQVWVDSQGQRIDFTGELREDGMYYEGPFRSQGKEVQSRMKFLKLPEGQVRQLWEQSADNGKTWKVLFDGLYVKKKAL